MSSEPDEREPTTTVDRIVADVREELVRRVARMDRERNREIYDALEDE